MIKDMDPNSLLANMESTDLEKQVLAVDSAVQICQLLSRAAVHSFARGTDSCYLIAERLGGFGSLIATDLEGLLLRSDNTQVRHLTALLLLDLGSYSGVPELLAAIDVGDYGCSAARALANKGIQNAGERIIARLRTYDPKTVDLGPSFASNPAKDMVVCLLIALEKLGEKLPVDLRDQFTTTVVPIEIRKLVEEVF